MDLVDGIWHVKPFLAVTLGIIVVFVGQRLNVQFAVLSRFSIPESVSGGLLFSILISLAYLIFSVEIKFDLQARDFLLVYFFTTIGINSNIRDLLKGGKPLVILLAITIIYMLLQNVIGISVASVFGLQPQVGLIGGTVSLIGGHGTAIAWAPRFVEMGIVSAMEIGMACATFGLILASTMGGPIANYLIKKHNLSPRVKESQDVGLSESVSDKSSSYIEIFNALLAIHVCIIIGTILQESLEGFGVALPLFVTCLFSGILISSIIGPKKRRLTGMSWPSRTTAVALIADISLSAFLAMSLMSLQLWTMVDLAGPILTILLMQALVAICITVFIVFRVMGKDYDAAVICAGFGGISLGSTPTAMANMTAITQRYGASHLAFLIVPLVCAFFIDLANAIMIPTLISIL